MKKLVVLLWDCLHMANYKCTAYTYHEHTNNIFPLQHHLLVFYVCIQTGSYFPIAWCLLPLCFWNTPQPMPIPVAGNPAMGLNASFRLVSPHLWLLDEPPRVCLVNAITHLHSAPRRRQRCSSFLKAFPLPHFSFFQQENGTGSASQTTSLQTTGQLGGGSQESW